MVLIPEQSQEFLALHGGVILFSAVEAGAVPATTMLEDFFKV